MFRPRSGSLGARICNLENRRDPFRPPGGTPPRSGRKKALDDTTVALTPAGRGFPSGFLRTTARTPLDTSL